MRWLLIAMDRARGAEGGRAIERLARQGYAIGDAHGWRQAAMAIAIPLERAGPDWAGTHPADAMVWLEDARAGRPASRSHGAHTVRMVFGA